MTWWTLTAGSQFGKFNKIITKGRHKGKAEVLMYGKLGLLPQQITRVAVDKLSAFPKEVTSVSPTPYYKNKRRTKRRHINK